MKTVTIDLLNSFINLFIESFSLAWQIICAVIGLACFWTGKNMVAVWEKSKIHINKLIVSKFGEMARMIVI